MFLARRNRASPNRIPRCGEWRRYHRSTIEISRTFHPAKIIRVKVNTRTIERAIVRRGRRGGRGEGRTRAGDSIRFAHVTKTRSGERSSRRPESIRELALRKNRPFIPSRDFCVSPLPPPRAHFAVMRVSLRLRSVRFFDRGGGEAKRTSEKREIHGRRWISFYPSVRSRKGDTEDSGKKNKTPGRDTDRSIPLPMQPRTHPAPKA